MAFTSDDSLSIGYTAALGDALLHAPQAAPPAVPGHLRTPVSLDAVEALTQQVAQLTLRVQRLEDWADLVDVWGTGLKAHREAHRLRLDELEHLYQTRVAALWVLEEQVRDLHARTWPARWARFCAWLRGLKER